MDKVSQETIDHIISFLTSKRDLASCSLIHPCFLSECRRIQFHTLTVNETVPCSTGYLWISDTANWTAKEAAINLQRYYPDICRYVREVQFCGGTIKKEDAAGLRELFIQLPLAKSFVLEGFSGVSGTLSQLLDPFRTIESLTFSRGVMFADDLNTLIPLFPSLTDMMVTPSTIVDIAENDISPEVHEVFSCLRSLDLSMPEVEDGSVEENYEWLHSTLSIVAGNNGLKMLSRSLRSIPSPSVRNIDLNIIQFPCHWAQHSLADLNEVDKALLKVVDRDRFVQMTVHCQFYPDSWYSRKAADRTVAVGFSDIQVTGPCLLRPQCTHRMREENVADMSGLSIHSASIHLEAYLHTMWYQPRGTIILVYSLRRSIHVIAPFSSNVSTATSRSYSIRDAVMDLIMLLPNVRTVAFFNVILDELPIYFGDCDHIKSLKLVFCRASIKGMNVFMNHFGHLDVMRLYLPEPTLSPLYFYNTQFLREPCQGFTDYMCRPDQQSRPVINKLIVLPALGVNALEWFSNPTTWYDPSGLISFHIVGNADHTNVTTFLKKVGPSVQDISSISTGDTRPFDLSYTPELLTLTLDTDVINMVQTHVSLLSLPKHSNLDNLTIVIRGPYFIPKIPTTIRLLPDALKSRCNWMRSFTVVYETTWSIINEMEFTRSKESEEELIGAALEKYSIEEHLLYCILLMHALSETVGADICSASPVFKIGLEPFKKTIVEKTEMSVITVNMNQT
ncbi:hypothetical protein EV421DRAFT_1735278 [Armillaria borealis]|uniref:Uncharacterized protein n=1 Tax=Armillaria borealis TaxID=47425 RepID=A0AA39JND2_9AGAR|nr:hypothetical protein EV421DRAFT_1735278 [Armillaria borealis]